jgi:RNA polymerase sigma-70 factor, ECF subfamily
VLARPRFLRRDDDVGHLLVALNNTFRNRRRDEVRRPRPTPIRPELELAEERAGGDPHAAAEAAEVYGAVAALPDDFRDVLVAVDVAGLSYKEAARSLRIPAGTVMSRLYRARRQVVQLVRA